MVNDFDKKLSEIKQRNDKLKLSDDLDTEEKMRKVIQALKLLIDDLIKRIEVLEKK